MADYDINNFVGSGAISTNAKGFADSLLEMAAYAADTAEKIIRKSVIDLYRRLVELTPVETGRAKASWMFSDSGNETTTAPEKKYSESEILSIAASNVREFTFDLDSGVVYILNNLEYIEALENGHSERAPYGMVAISLAEFEAYFRTQIRGLQGFSA